MFSKKEYLIYDHIFFSIWWRNTKEGGHFEDLGIDGRIVLK
jgi:hypothetical protein